jgi:RNA polymerase sigma factor (sigma-70 family)
VRTEDGYIIYKCLNGDPTAFGFLVDKYRAGVYAFAYERLHNFHDAEDIAQEVFFKAYRSLRTLRRWDSFASWLYRIALNQCRNWIRAQSSRPDHEFIEDQDPELLEAHSGDLHREELTYEPVREALDSLPEMYRQVLTLHYLGGMTSMEIARFIGASSAAVRKRLSKARSLLKEEILAMMSTTFEKQRLQSTFTMRIVEAVKRIKIHPTPRTAGLPWGLSLATGIAITILSLSPHLSIPGSMANPAGSRLAGEIPVNLLLLASKQGDGDGSVTATHSEGDAWTQENVADMGSTITDPETGLKYTKIFSDEKLDVIEDASWITVSPDGRFLFTQWGNWGVPLGEGDPFKLIDKPSMAEFPSWSPDGLKISFLSEGALWFVPVSLETRRATGPARKLAEGVRALSTWSADGKMIAYAAKGDIWKMQVAGGTPEQITDSPVKEFHPAWSPDGSRIAFVRVRDEKRKVRDIWLISPRGGNASKIIENGDHPRWSSDGKCILFLREKKLWIFQLSSKRECKIEPPGDWRAYFYSTKDGKFLFLDAGTSYRSALKVVSVYGGPSMDLCRNVDGKVWPYHQSWSPDGKWIITRIEEGERPNAIWMVSTSGKKSIPVHLEHVEEYYYPTPTWSPDGGELAYLSEDSSSRNRSLWVAPFSSDTGQPTGSAIKIADILIRDLNYGAISWSPDARKIAFTTRKSGNNDIWVGSVKGDKAVQLTDRAEDEMNPQWSPDGEKIAYVVEEKGSWVIPAAGGEPKQIIEEGEAYSWSPDASKIVFFAKPYISIIDIDNGEVKHIVDTEKLGAGGIFSISWSPDGKNLAFLSSWSAGYSKYDLWFVPATGGSPTKLATDDPGAKYSLYWSPDGKRISYSSDGYVKLRTAAIWEADVSELLSGMEKEQ